MVIPSRFRLRTLPVSVLLGASLLLCGHAAAQETARRVDSHMIHLGTMDAAAIAQAKRHDLVVLNPADASPQR